MKVMNFAKIFVEKISDMYEISCEHAHSCCVLISHKKFKKNGRWHTWIDYDKFNELVLSEKNFGPEDYIAETPGWAVVGAEEQGFDPGQTRFYRKGKDVSIKKRLEAEMKSRSEIVKDV